MSATLDPSDKSSLYVTLHGLAELFADGGMAGLVCAYITQKGETRFIVHPGWDEGAALALKLQSACAAFGSKSSLQ